MKKILIIWALLISVCFAQSKAGFYVVGGKIITVQDTSSRKYLKAIEGAGVVPSVTQNFASNYLVTTEKAIGTYTLIKAQYPFIGGTAGTHKFNLNDPRDIDGAYRLTFFGVINHTGKGVEWVRNLSNPAYAVTYFKSIYFAGTSKATMMYYSGTQSAVTSVEMGWLDIPESTSINFLTPGNLARVMFGNTIASVANTNTRGLILGTYNGTNTSLYLRGKLVASIASTINTTSTINFFIGARNGDQNTYPSDKLCSFSSIGDGLTDTQAIQMSNIVTFAQGILGRQ